MAKKGYVEEEDDDFDDDRFLSKSAPTSRTKTPVLDAFTLPFENINKADLENGVTYFMRETEINLILKSLLKTDRPHVAVIGEYGTGRETLIKSIVYKIYKSDASLTFNDYRFQRLDLEELIAGTKYRGQFEERLKAIQKEIENNKDIVVIYIKNIHDILTKKNANNHFNDLSYSLSSLLKTKHLRVITTLTSEEANNIFSDHSLSPLFYTIKISPPNFTDTYEIIKCNIPRFYSTYTTEVPDGIIKEIIEYSNLYIPEDFQPLKSLSMLEEVCASLELKRFANPKDVLHKLKIKYDQELVNLEKIRNEKNKVVTHQRFEEAASLRDQEKKVLQELEILKAKIATTGKKNRILITKDDLVEAIHLQTGIPTDKIIQKEKVVTKTKAITNTEYSSLPQFEFLQAQSVLHGHQIAIKTGLVFVLIPHNKEFDDLFYHYIKPALEKHGLNVLKADNIFKPGNILSQVWNQIRTAEIIVADVSGQNSNVIFELGLCYGIQRCPILLTRDPSELPFNIRNLRYIQYENTASGAHKLGEELNIAVGEFISAVRSDTN